MGRGQGGREGGTKKGQMAPSSSQPSGSGHAPSRNICRYFPGGEHKRTTDFSPRQSKRPILRPTPTGSRSRRAALPCPVSYFVSFPGARVPCPPSRLLLIQLHPFPLSPRRHGARASRFSILADGTCRAEGSVPPLSSHLLRRSFVESRPMELLARDKLVNSKRSSLISLKRNGTFHDRHGTKRSFLSIRV